MATGALDKLRGLLDELFLLDEPDLDFGLYRVMNARRREVERFRDHELAGVVTRALNDHQDLDRAALEAELAQVRADLQKLGVKEDASEKVASLKAQIARADGLSLVSDEVFAHLYAFFSRYYQSGDFHCRRQFREGVYAIPYEGEEVRLFWANADQYYIKTTQRHTTYEFVLPGEGRRVRFEVVGGAEERDNTKSARVFRLAEEPFAVDGNTLTLRFVHAPDANGRTQDEHNLSLAEALRGRYDLTGWAVALLAAEGDATRLAKRLRHFMRRETFDYFIHKDLGAFLRQELDHYLKTEVMRLDDIAHAAAPRVEEYLSKLKVMRSLGRTIIDFVAQLEDFQKRLWLKKKFVIDTHWLVSLGMVPRALWPQVIANDRQRDAWVRLCAIDKVANDLTNEGYTAPLSERFLELHPTLPVDTSLFDADFTAALLEALGDLDAKSLGLLVHGENFQALRLLEERFRGKVKCIYIDPPYNVGGDFAYKDTYKHSSWLSMMDDRLATSGRLLTTDGAVFCSIDHVENTLLKMLVQQRFEAGVLGEIIWKNATDNNPTQVAVEHENILCFSRDRSGVASSWKSRISLAKETLLAEYERLRAQGLASGQIQTSLREFIRDNAELVGELGRYKFVDDDGIYTGSESVHNPHPGGYSYTILHPQTGKPMRAPANGYRFPEETMRRDFIAKDRLLYGADENRIVKIKVYLSEFVEALRSVITMDGRLGPYAFDELFGKPAGGKRTIETLKPPQLIERLCSFVCDGSSYVLDYFAGSGTTAQAVFELNAALNEGNRFLLVEAADYFDTVLKPRVAKVMHAREWKDGVPVRREGTQGVVQVIRLESYDDTLDNLESQLDEVRQAMLFDNGGAPTAFGREYMLRYVLDHTTRGSPSMLDARSLEHPFDRGLRVTLSGAVQGVTVDVPETFHWLLGMTVTRRQRHTAPAVRVSWGALPDGRRAVTLWRDVSATPLAALEPWFCEKILPQLAGVDLVYVNGDENLERFRQSDHAWRVRRSEHEFVERMFAAGV